MENNTTHSCLTPSCTTGLTCPITGFNFYLNKKLIISSIIMIVWSNLFACFWHGYVMKGMYLETAGLWRPESEMNLSCLNGGISLVAFIATYIFLKGYQGSGPKEGLRFGILMGLLFLGVGLIAHATQPIPMQIIAMWSIGDFITYSIGTIIISALASRCCCSN